MAVLVRVHRGGFSFLQMPTTLMTLELSNDTERTAIKLDPSQQAAVTIMEEGRNVFLTGNAGTGKSTVITQFIAGSKRTIDMTATTGIAALNLRDQIFEKCGLKLNANTIYRWSGIGLGPLEHENDDQCFGRLCEEMKKPPLSITREKAFDRIFYAKCLIIDEISMLPGKTFQFLEYLCRKLRKNDIPWGGLQVICVGDFLQLPPVSRTGKYDWAFQNSAWQRSNFKHVVLQRIHRQDDDVFKDLLNNVREGRIQPKHSAILAKRVARFPRADLLRLFTHNTQVDRYNNMMLEGLETEEYELQMYSSGHSGCEWMIKNMLTPFLLKMKVGARMMVTANISIPGSGGALKAVNGSLGTLTRISLNPNEAELTLDCGRTIVLEPYTWWVDPSDEAKGCVRQLPLKLAWAATIHKSQGLSLDSALIDVRATREPGQTYVALSRVRSLSGLFLKDVFKGVWVSNEAIEFTNRITQS
jgi:ATP-dependent DNA helicase PIF1